MEYHPHIIYDVYSLPVTSCPTVAVQYLIIDCKILYAIVKGTGKQRHKRLMKNSQVLQHFRYSAL